MKKRKYKIVVLTDLNASTYTTVKSTVSLAKIIGGTIELFNVVSATDVVDIDNQLSSMRSIKDQHLKIEKEMESMIETYRADFGMDINYSFAFGNVKNELDRFIKASQPDLIVLGKRKPSTFKLIGDSITQYILKTFDGMVMIAAENNLLEPNESLTLGVLNGSDALDIKFRDVLLSNVEQPLKSFKTVDYHDTEEKIESIDGFKKVDYVFERGDNSIKNISNYLVKSNVNLLFLDRKEKGADKKAVQMASEISSIVNSIDISLLLGNR